MVKQGAFNVVVGIDKNNIGQKIYRVISASFVETAENQYDWKFNCKVVTESKLISAMQQNNKINWGNIKLTVDKAKGFEIKGDGASLDRFNTEHISKIEPMVIISEIVDKSNKTLGYKVADYNGNVRNIALKELIAFAHRVIGAQKNSTKNIVPIQNAIFVPADGDKKAFFKSYPNKEFIVEKIDTNKNKYTSNKRVQISKNQKTLSKLEEIYRPEQIEQLKLGKANGVDIRIYANPALSAEQMKAIRDGLEKRLNMRPLAFPEYSTLLIRYYTDEMENGIDIRKILNPKYNIGQLAELSLAVELGLDISKMANPDNSADAMAEIRQRLQAKIWKDELVKKSGLWK